MPTAMAANPTRRSRPAGKVLMYANQDLIRSGNAKYGMPSKTITKPRTVRKKLMILPSLAAACLRALEPLLQGKESTVCASALSRERGRSRP